MSFSYFRKASSGQYPDAQGVQVFIACSEVNLWNLRLSLPWKTGIPFSCSPFPFLSPFNPFSIGKPAWSLKTRHLMVQILSVASQYIQIKIQTHMSCCARSPAPCFCSITCVTFSCSLAPARWTFCHFVPRGKFFSRLGTLHILFSRPALGLAQLLAWWPPSSPSGLNWSGIFSVAFPDHFVHPRVCLKSLLLCTHRFYFPTLNSIYNYKFFFF